MQGHTIYFDNRPKIIATATVAGPKETEGIVGKYVDLPLNNDMFNEETYEKAERKMLAYAIEKSIQNANLAKEKVDLLISGDLLNQIISASFAARQFGIPFLGVYSACSTMSEAFALSASMVNAGYADTVVAATGSHFSSAERQYRYPLELGCTRPPQSQWTVTGAGSAVISNKGEGVSITAATFGKVVDFGVTDVNNMGAAMAPAAADSLLTHFKDTGLAPEDYDLILTGDLGALGSRILKDLMWEKGVDISANHVDCGEVIYKVIEDEFQGGSGAGCSAVVFNSYIYDKMMRRGEIKKVLFAATGALLSTTSSQQGDSIPCISHAVVLER
ncbi:stage V sporulation protein AD [Candidatus Borkfalkia ceftriaxoniphila]|uniref:Stage V sporulation protein AD n=1 Tax=Candidatus Borkfalkia ceftriaxoniphila TaxID=2508949 RepID=A0A4Q2KBS2_9FIRM|nr:stage V sporulation protein AD [Candidatus Borkfalkia ceftriaxoniphila]RXZ60942.1 stage V sporulation protein AD [Candidatus Borkfalkia ceftriaxoniphila]